MQKSMTEVEPGHSYASLHPVFKGDNPENVPHNVKYEKGFMLLNYMESLIGIDKM